MKNLPFFLLFCLLFAFSSCEEDNMMSGPDDESPMVDEAILLECRPTTDILLTNHNQSANQNGLDYIIDCSTFDIDGVEVTIEPGTHIQVGSGNRIIVTDDGALIAEGTSSERIRIFGEEGGTQATWDYLWFQSTNVKNKLNFVDIVNAGSTNTPNGNYDEVSAVFLNGRLSMTNSSISHSDGNGLTTLNLNSRPSFITEFSSNTIRGCANYPMSVTGNEVGSYDFMSCTFTDNGEQSIRVSAEQGELTVTTENTWLEAPLPYFVDSPLRFDANLIIEAGVEIIFGSGGGFSNARTAPGSPYIRVNGTEDKHVVMRGEIAQAGAWRGILIETSSIQNEFNYVDISDGGQIPLSNITDNTGNFYLDYNNARLILNNCTSTRAECDVVIRPASSWDFFLENNSPGVTVICED